MAVVFYDLETTGLNTRKCEVLEIGARCGEATFHCYIMPRNGINPGATSQHGLSIIDTADGRWLCKKGKILDTMDAKDAWFAFIYFLKSSAGNGAVLVAHNGRRFDHPIMMRCVTELGLRSLLLSVEPYAADTMQLFPKDGQSRGLVATAKRNGVSTSGAHTASGDVDMMRSLCREFGINDGAIFDCAQPLTNFG